MDKANELRFQVLLSRTHDGVARFLTDGTLIECNPALVKMLGYRSQQDYETGENGFNSSLDILWKTVRPALDKVINSGSGIELNLELVRHQDEAVEFDLYVCAFQESPQDEVEIWVIARDITLLRQNQDVVYETNKFLTALVEASPVVMISYDLAGRIISWNPAAVEVFEWTSGDVLGKVDPTIPEDLISEHEIILQKTFRGEFVRGVSTRRRSKSGKVVLVDLMTSRLHNSRGEVNGLIVMMADVTHQKIAEQALQDSETRYRTLFETSPDGVTLTDLEGNFQAANQRMLQMHGFSSMDDLIASGWNAFDIIVPEERLKAIENTKKTAQLGKLSGILYHARRKDGSIFPLEIDSTAIIDENGQISAYMAITRDVTERCIAEDELLRHADEIEVLYSTLRKQSAETEALYRASAPLLFPGYDLGSLAEKICQVVTKEFSTFHASIFMISDETKEVIMLAQAGETEDKLVKLIMDGPGVIVQSIHQKEPVYVPDVDLSSNYVPGLVKTRSELAIPLSVGERVIGVLNLESPDVDAFDASSQRILTSYADKAALALENARLFHAIEAHDRQMQFLNELTHLSLESSNLNQVLNAIITHLGRFIEADTAVITLLDEVSNLPVIAAVYGVHANELKKFIVSNRSEPAITHAVFELAHVLVVNSSADKKFFSEQVKNEFPHETFIIVPLNVNGERIGGTILGFKEQRRISNEDLLFFEQTGDQIALAVAKSRSLEMAQRRALEAENLRQATAALNSSLDLNVVLQTLLDHLERAVHYDCASVFLIEGESMRPVALRGLSTELFKQKFPSNDPLLLESRRLSSPIILEDAREDPRFRRWGETDQIRGWMGVALINQNGETIGWLTIDSKKKGAFGPEQAALSQAFANQATIAIENARLHAQVQDMALTDPMTGLLNRRGFFGLGQREVDRFLRLKRPLSVIMMDVDYLKKINDSYGHAVGDWVLKTIANHCLSSLRKIDLVCRYGGDEFVILLPEVSLDAAAEIAERIRAIIAATQKQCGADVVTLSASMGVAEFDAECQTIEGVLIRADEMLYISKRMGRNRVVAWKTNFGDIHETGHSNPLLQ